MGRRFVAILNPVSGRRNMLPVARRIRRVLQRHASQLDIQVTDGAGHATEIAAQLHDDVDAVLVVGGDGTVCEVVNGLVGRCVPIVILGTGTENLLARELQMPAKPDRVVDTLLSGEPFACDIGVINERHFLAVAGVGFDADCVLRLARARRGHITHGTYFWPIWHTFWTHRFPRLRIEVDNRRVFDSRGFAIMGIIGRYAAGLRILPEARYNDGLLDVCAFECDSKPSLLRHTWRIFRRRHVESRGVVYRQGRRISITSPDCVNLEIDGDTAGCLPATCGVLPGAARFLRPPEGAGKKI